MSSKLLSDTAIEMLCDLHFHVWVLKHFQKYEFNWCAPVRKGHKLIHTESTEASLFPNSQTWTSSSSLVLCSYQQCLCSRLHSARARLRNIKGLTFAVSLKNLYEFRADQAMFLLFASHLLSAVSKTNTQKPLEQAGISQLDLNFQFFYIAVYFPPLG